MKRVGLVSLVFACAVAGSLSAFALADNVPLAVTTTTTTATTTTTSPAPPPQPLPEGVMIAGVPVGGLLPTEAAAAVRAWFDTSLPLRFGDLTFAASPRVLASPGIPKAVERAKTAPPFARVPLAVTTRRLRIRNYIAAIAKRIDRPSTDSRLFLRRGTPFVTKEKAGRVLLRPEAERAVERALEANARTTIVLRTKPLRPSLTRKNYGPVIVIHRGGNRLNLYRGMRPWRAFGVATGQSAYPTPLGRFEIVVKWKNPWWYPPDSPWAKDEKPIPPGPGNPLGTRWMGISSPGVGIHGTPDPASIGYSVSHGCIRMLISDAEWLFNNVPIGTPVFILSQ
jgi:lipoprotein-anchoring transpeptidase ErfK/SrfK